MTWEVAVIYFVENLWRMLVMISWMPRANERLKKEY
jgi:hypothetical protein